MHLIYLNLSCVTNAHCCTLNKKAIVLETTCKVIQYPHNPIQIASSCVTVNLYALQLH